MPDDFLKWYQMMVTEFGTRFGKLFRGPAWSGCDKADFNYSEKAKMNVAAVSHVTVTQENRKSPYHISTDIQHAALVKLKETNPSGRFWIKLDATDIRPALQESVKGEWAGDCDLLDGRLQLLRQQYDDRRAALTSTTPDVACLSQQFSDDVTFLSDKLKAANHAYATKTKDKSCSQSKLKDLNWEKVELAVLLQQAEDLKARYADQTQDSRAASQVHKGLQDDLVAYCRSLFKKKRQPAASHVLVIMLSDERRATKPYALPVQYIPYHSITDDKIRELTSVVKQSMKEIGLTCVGTVTDGEFSTLRTSGENNVPTHVYEIIKRSRAKVQNKSVKTLRKMVVKNGENADGSPTTELPSKVPPHIVERLSNLQNDMSWSEALTTVRKELVPQGYVHKTWKPFIEEDEASMLKSLLATYDYRATIDEFFDEGRDFNNHLYVPVVDPVTEKIHLEREDHNHVLKRIAKHLRAGNIPDVDFRRFVEAKDTGIISEAILLGHRKQSVGDAERLLSFAVADFFKSKGYTAEEEFVRMVAKWHEASDGRGLSQFEREEANASMLTYIKRQWIPWWDTRPGLKFLDINVRVHEVCGFSRESILGITTNIETQEWRRQQNSGPY